MPNSGSGIMTYVAYIAFAAILSIFIARKSDSRLYVFLISFWLFASSTMLSKFVYKLPVLGFDIQINRIYLFILLAYICFKPSSGEYAPNKSYIGIIFIIYIIAVILSLLANINNVQYKFIFSIVTDYMVFVLFYYASKKASSVNVIRSICSVFIVLAFCSIMIACVQMVTGNDFFNLEGYYRESFFIFKRTPGVFQYEYIFGYMVNIAIVILLVMSNKYLYVMLPVLYFSFLMIFHRMNMLVACTNFIFISVFGPKVITVYRGIMLLVFGILTSIVIAVIIYGSGVQTDMLRKSFQQGMFVDSVSGRLNQDEIVINLIRNTFFGVGQEETSKAYYATMAKYGMIKGDGEVLNVHNGYLRTGVRLGVLPMIMTISLIIYQLIYYFRRTISDGAVFIIPFCCWLLWAMANMSNGVDDLGGVLSLTTAIISGLFVSITKNQAKELIAAE